MPSHHSAAIIISFIVLFNYFYNFRLFLVMIVLCMAAEIGGIIALSVYNQTVSSGGLIAKDDKLFFKPRENYFYCFILNRLETFCTWAGRKLTRRPRTLSRDRSVNTNRKQVSSKKGEDIKFYQKCPNFDKFVSVGVLWMGRSERFRRNESANR